MTCKNCNVKMRLHADQDGEADTYECPSCQGIDCGRADTIAEASDKYRIFNDDVIELKAIAAYWMKRYEETMSVAVKLKARLDKMEETK